MATNGTTNGTNCTNGTANGHHDLPALCTSAEDFLQHNYDFVVVGGGVAGLTVAARLTENPDVTVGVFEAGKNKLNDMLVDTPGMFLALLNNPEYDWQYNTVPQVGKADGQASSNSNSVLGSQQGQGPQHPARQGTWR